MGKLIVISFPLTMTIQVAKAKANKLIAVRETSVSQHHGGSFEETP